MKRNIQLYYRDDQEELARMTSSILKHLKDKTGYSYGEIALKALHEYNLIIDDRGNRI